MQVGVAILRAFCVMGRSSYGKPPRPRRSGHPMDNTFREQFRNASPQQLADALNREVGNAGWVTARGFYLTALREAFLATGLDCSGFINDGGMRLTTVRLDGDTVVPLADAPTPPDAPELPAAGSAGDLDDQSLVDALIRSMAWGHDARVREFGERLCVGWPGARGEGDDGILRVLRRV